MKIKIPRTIISLKLPGMPVSSSNTSRTPSGGHLTRSLTSLATRASVLGGKFSELPAPRPPPMDPPEPETDRAEDERRDGFRSCMDPDSEEPMLPTLAPREMSDEEAVVLLVEKSEPAVLVVEMEDAMAVEDVGDDHED